VSKEEALGYLKRRKIDEKQATRIYELVGGRVIHLKFMADKIEEKITFEGMCIACYAMLVSHRLYSYARYDVHQRRRTTRVR